MRLTSSNLDYLRATSKSTTDAASAISDIIYRITGIRILAILTVLVTNNFYIEKFIIRWNFSFVLRDSSNCGSAQKFSRSIFI